MGLLRHFDEEPELVGKCVEALESYLVRRMVCGEQTRGYGTVAVSLVGALRVASDASGRWVEIVRVLSDSGWPDDAKFQEYWLKSRFYRWFRQARVLTLLRPPLSERSHQYPDIEASQP